MWVRSVTSLTEDPLSDTGSPTRMYTDPMYSSQVTLTETAGYLGSPPGRPGHGQESASLTTGTNATPGGRTVPKGS